MSREDLHANENFEEEIDWKTKIEESVKKYPIMIFMRGTPNEPRCGFSARVMSVMKKLDQKHGVDFGTEDMDSDPKLWETLKELNDWPTSPQIYVNGEFIGGCDIFVEMFKSGELAEMLKKTNSN